MTVYSTLIKKKVKGQDKKEKVWRYDFQFKGQRYQSQNYPTKTTAKEAEDKKRAELKSPQITKQTSLTFFEMVNRRLAYMQVWNSEIHFKQERNKAKRWVARWKDVPADEMTQAMISQFVQERARGKSAHTGNREIVALKALFNWARKQKPPLVKENPVDGIDFIPIKDKFVKYVPPKEDVIKVLWVASQKDQCLYDYLVCIFDTKGRVSEINRLSWEDVSLSEGLEPWKRSHVILWTRKKKGGNITPRQVPLTKRLYEILLKRWKERDKTVPYIFHAEYVGRDGSKQVGPYSRRWRVMKNLCKEAGVKDFGYHSLRHLGASIMGNSSKVSISAIQRILGHESPKTTEIYLHSIGDAERKAMEVFEEESAIKEKEGKEGEK